MPFRDSQTSSKVHTYCPLQLQFLPHQYKLRIASCTDWSAAWTVLKSPSILSRGFDGSSELWSLYGYMAELRNLNQFFAAGFYVEFLGFSAFSWEQRAQGKQNIRAGLCCADWKGWVIKNGIPLSHTNNSSWRAREKSLPIQGSTFRIRARGTAAIPILPFFPLSMQTQ